MRAPVGIRVWLPLAFALVAAVTAIAVERGEPVQLTPSEFKLLALLSERPGEVFSRAQIMRHLWGATTSATSTRPTSTSRTCGASSSGTPAGQSAS